MNEAKQLFQDIKSIFLKEGVNVEKEEMNTEDPETAVAEETTTEETQETVAEKFEDVTLADGSVAQVEPDVSLGSAMVVQVDEELLPAPDGEHELSDGRMVTTESGIIVDIKEMEEAPEVEEEVDEEMEKDSPFTDAQQREAKKIIESIVTERVFGMESTLAEETQVLKKDIEDLKNAFGKLVELTEKLVQEPTTKSVKKNKSGFDKLRKNKVDIIEKLKKQNIIK
jgi:hypothetical protein|tara:strand:- start:2675 stop:3352 length:678 start_codon:yes stop_codon:yes gene_type:complete